MVAHVIVAVLGTLAAIGGAAAVIGWQRASQLADDLAAEQSARAAERERERLRAAGERGRREGWRDAIARLIHVE